MALPCSSAPKHAVSHDGQKAACAPLKARSGAVPSHALPHHVAAAPFPATLHPPTREPPTSSHGSGWTSRDDFTDVICPWASSNTVMRPSRERYSSRNVATPMSAGVFPTSSSPARRSAPELVPSPRRHRGCKQREPRRPRQVRGGRAPRPTACRRWSAPWNAETSCPRR
jgi:hypothetical protein